MGKNQGIDVASPPLTTLSRHTSQVFQQFLGYLVCVSYHESHGTASV